MKLFNVSLLSALFLAAVPTYALDVQCTSAPIGPNNTTLTISGNLSFAPIPVIEGSPEVDAANGSISFSLSSDPAIPEPHLPDEVYSGQYSQGVLSLDPTDSSLQYGKIQINGNDGTIEFQGQSIPLNCGRVPGGISSGS